MNKIRVANILEESQIGGPQLRIISVAKKIRKSIETIVILPSINSKRFIDILEREKVEYKTLYLNKISKNIFLAFKYIFFFPFELIQLIFFFKKQKFDIIHISGGAWQFKSLISAKISGSIVIWHLNDTYMPKFIRLIFFLLRKLPNAYIFSSRRTQIYYGNILSDVHVQKKIIQAPVDTAYFHYLRGFKNKNIKNEKIIIGTVGNVSPVKGTDIFIEIASQLNHTSFNFEFLIVGLIPKTQKKYYRSLMNKIRKANIKNITFTGAVDDTKYFLKKIDIYLCTSRFESSPLSVWEAMSMSKILISSNVGDVQDYLRLTGLDTIVQVGDTENYIKNIMKFIYDQNLGYKYGLQLREISKKFLDISVCSQKHEEIYKKINYEK